MFMLKSTHRKLMKERADKELAHVQYIIADAQTDLAVIRNNWRACSDQLADLTREFVAMEECHDQAHKENKSLRYTVEKLKKELAKKNR